MCFKVFIVKNIISFYKILDKKNCISANLKVSFSFSILCIIEFPLFLYCTHIKGTVKNDSRGTSAT